MSMDIKKIITLMLVSIFLVTLLGVNVSAEELLQFDNIKQYDEETKTVTIVNTFNLGRDISTIQLKTPLNYLVGAGYGKVAEFEVDLFDDTYSDAFDKMEFYNKRNMDSIERQFDYKYLTTEMVTINEHEDFCLNCYEKVIGTHQEEREVWKDFDTKTLIKGKITIGIFTDVQVGDYVEWIPTLFGKEIDEWASFEQAFITSTTGHTSSSNTNSQTGKTGFNITSEFNISIVNITKFSNGNPTKMYIQTSYSSGILGTATFIGNTATFNPTVNLTASVVYSLLVDNEGNAYDRAFDPVSYSRPTVNNGITWDFDIGPTGASESIWQSIHTLTYINYTLITGFPEVDLNTPINTSNFTTSNINFGGVVSDDVNLINVSLIIDNVYIETNSSGINNSNYTFSRTLSNGDYIWTYEGCDNESLCTNGTARTFNIDALPNVTLISPANATSTTTALITFNGTVTTPITDLINVSLIINNIINETNTSGLEGNYNFSVLLSQQVLTWNYQACNPSGCINGTERTLEIHLTPVTIVIIEPTGTEDYVLLGSNQTITWNITEPGVNLSEHVIECLYTYNGTTYNVTDNCLTTNTTSFPYQNGLNFLNFSVTEEFGIKTEVNSTWDYKLIEINNTFNNETTEGNLETFLAYTQILSGLTVSSVSLIYNNTEYTGESFIIGSNTVFRKTDLLVDDLSVNANLSFYWTVTLSDSTEINLSTQNQTVYVLGVDGCSVFTNEILNFTSVDEETQVQLVNVTIETATNIYTNDRSQLILNYSNLSNTNPTRVCLNINLTAVSNYSLDVIVRYENPISANEYYNIVDLELTDDTGRQDITLYDLNLSDSTEFQLTFVGSDFLPVENALVYVDRQYISENIFKTVELPKTDFNGQAVLHLVRNDVIYNIRVVKDGAVLGNFENLVAFCDDFTIGDCNIELNAFDSVQSIFDQDSDLGIIFTSPTYNETSNIISFNYLTDDGTAKTVTMNVTRNDIFGNRSICETSLTSSGGTLTCAINPNLEETILITSIYVDGEQVALDQVRLDSSNYGAAGYLILFVFALSLIFMFAPTGKTGILISMVLSVIGATGLGLVSGDLIGIGASGIWLLVIVIVGIYKLNKEKRQ